MFVCLYLLTMLFLLIIYWFSIVIVAHCCCRCYCFTIVFIAVRPNWHQSSGPGLTWSKLATDFCVSQISKGRHNWNAVLRFDGVSVNLCMTINQFSMITFIWIFRVSMQHHCHFSVSIISLLTSPALVLTKYQFLVILILKSTSWFLFSFLLKFLSYYIAFE